jgi:Helicase associated domain
MVPTVLYATIPLHPLGSLKQTTDMQFKEEDINNNGNHIVVDNRQQRALQRAKSGRKKSAQVLAKTKEPASKVEHNRKYNCTHIRKFEEKFKNYLEAAWQHFKENGTWLLTSIKDRTLRNWVTRQRMHYNKGRLCRCRLDRLEAMGLQWSEDRNKALEDHWDAMYEKLKAYKEEHGTCQISQNLSGDLQLQSWSHAQNRVCHLRGGIRPDRKARLDLLGFFIKPSNDIPFLADTDEMISTIKWSKEEDAEWEAMYRWLKAYKEEHGHCNVGRFSKRNTVIATLMAWVKAQRSARLQDTRPDRAAKLDMLEFCSFYANRASEKRKRQRQASQNASTKQRIEDSQSTTRMATPVSDQQDIEMDVEDKNKPAVRAKRSRYNAPGNETIPAAPREFQMTNHRHLRSLRCLETRDESNGNAKQGAFVSGSVAQQVMVWLATCNTSCM